MNSLIQRRDRRGWWAYAMLALAYFAVVALVGMKFGPPAWWLVPLSIPVLVVLFQLLYPTTLCWGVIVIATASFTGWLIYDTIKYEDEMADTTGTVLNWLFISYLLVVTASLFIVRPRIREIGFDVIPANDH